MLDLLEDVLELSQGLEVELDSNPLLSYRHLPGPNGQTPGPQEQFHKCKAKVKGLFGGNRSGKSSEGAEYMISKALVTPNGRGWAACPSNEMSIEVQQRKIWQYLPKDQVEYARYDPINGFTHGKVLFRNGFSLIFKAYEQGVEKFQSDDIDLIWLDEEPPYSLYLQCLMRTLDRGGEVFFTMTPVSGHTKFVDEVLLKKKTDNSQAVRVFMLNTADNTTLSKTQVDFISSQVDEDDAPALLHGIPVNKSGLVYKEWKDQYPHVVPVELWEKVKDKTTRFTSIDPHNRTPSAVGFYGVDRDGRFWLFDEIFSHLLLPELVAKIKEKEGNAPAMWRTIDTSAQIGNLTDGLTLRMQMFQPPNNLATVLAKKDHKNQHSITMMRNMLSLPKDGGLPMFVVVENCVRARYEFQRYSWASYSSEKLTEEKEGRNEVKKKDDHIMDCNHYVIRSYAAYQGDDRGQEEQKLIEEPVGAFEINKMQETEPISNWTDNYRA